MPSSSNLNIRMVAIFVIAVLLAWPPATQIVHGQVEICAKGCNNLLLSCMSWCSDVSGSSSQLQELRALERCVKRCNKSFEGCTKWCNQLTRRSSPPMPNPWYVHACMCTYVRTYVLGSFCMLNINGIISIVLERISNSLQIMSLATTKN
jgi:hypothetical protein